MEVEKQVQKAANLIARLREEDTECRVFGAESHRYRLGPTMSETELRAFETKHKIELPPDYRLYLKTVGNGNGNPLHEKWGSYGTAGAGPYYGIYRIEGTLLGNRTHEPFPFTQETPPENGPAEESHSKLIDFWDEDIPGLLEIGTEGCGYNNIIVVQGESYGTMWGTDGSISFYPTGFSFTDWICDWAERCIPRVIRERVTNPVKVGMSLIEVDAICGDNGHRPHTRSGKYLRFEGLATAFDVDERDVVTRIIAHSI